LMGRAATLAVVASITCGCAATIRPGTRRPVEVWRGGDDGLTLRFTDALEEALIGSVALAAGQGKLPGTLVVTIPTNLRWEAVGRRTRVFYDIVLTDHLDRRVGRTGGTCWDDQLGDCAARVRTYVETVSREMR